MADNPELFSTLIQGLAALNQRLNDLEIDSDGTKQEINDFQGEYAKEVKLLQEQIDDISVQIDRMIREEISKIELPKDGKDGKDYDEQVAKALLKAELNKLVTQRNLETAKIKDEVLQAVSEIQIPKGEKGEDGKSVTDDQIQTYISAWLDENIDSLKGEQGERGISGESGPKGKDGEDGLTIEDMYEKNGYLVIILSDGTKKELKLPAIEKHTNTIRAGGADTTEIVSTLVNLDLTPKSQTVLVDATAGDVTIKMPEPSLCINSQRSYKIAVSKIDASTNTVTIVPFSGESIAGDTNQILYYNTEVLNFVTDGANWYIGA